MVVLIAMIVVLLNCVHREIEKPGNIPVDEIDLSSISDGSYKGDYTYSKFTYKVEVTVEAHQIESIRIIHNANTDRARKAETIVTKVLDAQSVKVDAVTGATMTSKALLKAIKNALKNASG